MAGGVALPIWWVGGWATSYLACSVADNTVWLLLLLFGRPVMWDAWRPHGLQQARPPCPSPSPKVCPSSGPLHQWCHPAISSSDTLFSFCPQPCIRVSSYESTLLIRGSKNWSFSFSISPSNECSRFISLKIDLFDQLFGYLHIKPNHSSSHSSRCVWWRYINTFKTSDDLFKPRKMIFFPLKLKTSISCRTKEDSFP